MASQEFADHRADDDGSRGRCEPLKAFRSLLGRKSLELPLMLERSIALAKWASLKSLAENRPASIC